MNVKRNSIVCSILALAFSANAQLGNIKDKVKDKTKETKEIPAQPQTTPASSTDPSSIETIKTEKDANGFIINDPEVAELFKGKDVYHATDIRLFASILETANPFKMAGVAVNKTAQSLGLFVVAQRQYGGVYKKEVSLTLIEGEYYKYESSNPFYAMIQNDGSILLFNSRYSELISKDEATIKSATEENLNARTKEPLAKMKQKSELEKQNNAIAQNESFYKSGGARAVKSDAALESQFLKVLNQANELPTVLEKNRVSYKKVMLIYTDWTVEKNDLGVPLKMVYATWAIGNYTADKRCFFQKVYLKKDYLGGGKYGEVKYDESQSPSIISCELLK
jgi:hypothetical protein